MTGVQTCALPIYLVTDLDAASWSGELELHDALFKQLANRLPDELPQVRQRIAARLAG